MQFVVLITTDAGEVFVTSEDDVESFIDVLLSADREVYAVEKIPMRGGIEMKTSWTVNDDFVKA